MALRAFDIIVGAETDALPVGADAVADEDVVTKGFADSSYVQGAQPVDNNAALKAIIAADRADRDVRYNDGANALYAFDSSSGAADDGDNVLAPDAGTGRWIKTSNI